MRRGLRTLTTACIAAITLGCPDLGPGGGGDKALTISTQDEAEAAFYALRVMAQDVDQQVSTNFAGPFMISGATGTASVSGTKTSSSTSSSSSTSTTRTSDLYVSFADFRSFGDMTVTGTVRWYDYYYSRTACSSFSCASASDDYESLEGTSISITFEYDGKTYSDVIDIDASSGSDTSSWSVDLTTRSGLSFSFTDW